MSYQKVYQFYRILANLVYLNILWFLFTLAGGIVFGIMPATSALFASLRNNLQTEQLELAGAKTYLKFYKASFVTANISGIFYLLLGSLLYINLQITSRIEGNLFFALKIATIILIVGLALSFVLYFPTNAHYRLKGFQLLKQPLILMLLCPIQSAIVLFTMVVSNFLFQAIPGLIPLFYVSLPALLVMRSLYKKYQDLPGQNINREFIL